eukprot:7199615-Prymnesium_polylepis.1
MDSSAVNFISLATIAGPCEMRVPGCMAETASNFDSVANTYDGSCIFHRIGCMDSDALNFDALATQNADCIPLVPGCMFESADNYQSDATRDDGTCIFKQLGCTDSSAMNYRSQATHEDPENPC